MLKLFRVSVLFCGLALGAHIITTFLISIGANLTPGAFAGSNGLDEDGSQRYEAIKRSLTRNLSGAKDYNHFVISSGSETSFANFFGVYCFTYPNELFNETILNANLRIPVSYGNTPSKTKFNLRVAEVVLCLDRDGNASGFNVTLEKTVPLHHDNHIEPHWYEINMKDAITKAMAHFKFETKNKIFLLIGAVDSIGRPVGDISVATSVDKDGKDENPYIELLIDENHKHRQRRSASVNSVCDEESDVSECCRFPMTVNLNEENLGMNAYKFIFPTKFEAYYCSGICSQGTESKRATSCKASRKSPLTVLSFSDATQEEIIMETVPDMIVEECACFE